jgi:glycosyltransferase involved in cell wall biosynthesis
MIVGVFHPGINGCGGAEWVAIQIINALKEHGHQVIILTDSKLNQAKFTKFFNVKVTVDQQIILPLRVFPAGDWHNIYIEAIRSKILKSKCDKLIDTYSSSILPGMDVAYIHYPMLKLVETEFPYLRNKLFYYPHRMYLDFSKKKTTEKLFFANSKFTADAVKKEFDVDSHVLYPPISNNVLNQNKMNSNSKRENMVLTISRIAPDKNLEILPYVAQKSSKNASFIIAGHLQSKETFSSLKALIKKLKVAEKIKIIPNIDRSRLNNLLLTSKVYFHTKINEHFGISIIEAMYSGCIPIVHNSGGPKEFVPSKLRFATVDEAAQKIDDALEHWSVTRSQKISESTLGFSESNFCKQFMEIFNSFYS